MTRETDKGNSAQSRVVMYQAAMKDLMREFRNRAKVCERTAQGIIPGGTTCHFDYGCASAFNKCANRVEDTITRLSEYNAPADRTSESEFGQAGGCEEDV